MSRADELRARHEAELAVVELEDELLAAKDSGDVSQELKQRLREARRVHRELRADEPAAVGYAIVSPNVISASVTVSEVG